MKPTKNFGAFVAPGIQPRWTSSAKQEAQARRWMLALAVVPAVAFGIGLMFIPNSPRWLVARGHADQARAFLKLIRSPDQVESELSEIGQSVAQQEGTWSELLSPLLRSAMIVGVGLAIAQQVTGINTVIYYAPTILKFAGMSSAPAAILASVGVGIVNDCQLGRQPAGGFVLFDSHASPGQTRHLLVVWRRHHCGVALCLFPGAGDQGQNARTD